MSNRILLVLLGGKKDYRIIFFFSISVIILFYRRILFCSISVMILFLQNNIL